MRFEMTIISREIQCLAGTEAIKIYGLKIGRLAIKKKAMYSQRPGVFSTLLSFTDHEFADWLPVWTWIIVHPEGTFLIDTGLSSEVNQTGYFKELDFISKYYFEQQMKFDISKENEIDTQLNKIGINADAISKVLLTHLHLDHTGGLKHFPNTPIYVAEKEWKTKDGSFPKLFPSNLNIQTVKLDDSFESFEECHYLTESRDLLMISTPGHTRGHVSLALIAGGKRMYLFGGDVAYSQKRLLEQTFSATINSHKSNLHSCKKILELAKKRSIVFMPSHDPNNADRLKHDQEINP